MPADHRPRIAHDWLAELGVWLSERGVAGVEGRGQACLRSLPDGRAGWLKVHSRAATEYVIGGVTGSLIWPVSLLLGRFDSRRVLRYAGQTLKGAISALLL